MNRVFPRRESHIYHGGLFRDKDVNSETWKCNKQFWVEALERKCSKKLLEEGHHEKVES